MNKINFLRRAETIHLPSHLKEAMIQNQESLNLLEEMYGAFFQVHHVEAILSGNTSQASTNPQQISQADQQPAIYQLSPDQPQAIYYTQPTAVSSNTNGQNKHGLTTAILFTAIIMALLGAYFLRNNPIDGNDLFGNFTSESSRPADAPTSCGGDIPNTFLNFGMWKNEENDLEYFVPGNSPALQMETSAICFNIDEMKRFYSQTDITTKSGVVTGQEALARAILGAMVKSNLITNTDPRYLAVYEALVKAVSPENIRSFEDPAYAKYGYLLLPGLGEFANIQPTSSPTHFQPAVNQAQPIIPTSTALPPPTQAVMAINVVPNTPTNIPLPTIEAVSTQIAVVLPTLMQAYDVTPLDTSQITPIVGPPAVTLAYMIENNLLRYGACTIIPDAGSLHDFSQRWPMDNVFTMFLGGICGDGEGPSYVVQLPTNYQSHHVNDSRYRNIHISASPHPNWGPSMQIPGTPYYIQPFIP